MTSRQFSLVGMVTPVWFLLVYLVMSSLRPDYSFLTKAISELGSIDAPNKGWWNVLGYIVPGVTIAIFSVGLFKKAVGNGKSKFPLIGIFGSGVLMALSGVFPADMDHRQSFTTMMHSIGSFGSYIFFLLGAFSYPREMRKSAYWSAAVKPALLFTWLTIFFGAWPFVFPHMPGVGQRLVFFFYFLWIFNMGWKLYKEP